MMKVYVINGKAFIWNAEDVYILRTKHHIVGSLVGCFPRQTFQNSQMWLPLQLLQEEATLLVEKGIAQLVTSSKVGKITHPDNVEYFFKFRESLCVQQIDLHKEIRQKTILEKADIIYEGKKQKVLKKLQGKVSKRKKKKRKTNESCKQSIDHNSHGSVNAKSHDKCNKTNESSDEIITDEDNFCVITNSVFSTNDEHSSNANQICPEGLVEGDTKKNYKIKSSDKCENFLEVVKELKEISEIENESCALVTNKKHNSNVKVTNFGETQRVNQTININEKNIHGNNSNILNQDSCYETGHSNECITIDKEVYVVKSITMHRDNDEDMNKNDGITRKQLYKHSDGTLEIGKEIDENSQTDENKSLQPCSSTFIDIPEIDRDAIIAEEMMKIQNLKKETCMVQLFTECPWKTEEDDKIALWNYPHTEQEKLRYAVFKDLWEKGYYLTAGTKFGGDFLAYAGDPVKYHALYIIVCIPFKHNFQAIDLVVLGRLGNQVKKTVSLASMTPGGTVEYISLKWASETS